MSDDTDPRYVVHEEKAKLFQLALRKVKPGWPISRPRKPKPTDTPPDQGTADG